MSTAPSRRRHRHCTLATHPRVSLRFLRRFGGAAPAVRVTAATRLVVTTDSTSDPVQRVVDTYVHLVGVSATRAVTTAACCASLYARRNARRSMCGCARALDCKMKGAPRPSALASGVPCVTCVCVGVVVPPARRLAEQAVAALVELRGMEATGAQVLASLVNLQQRYALLCQAAQQQSSGPYGTGRVTDVLLLFDDALPRSCEAHAREMEKQFGNLRVVLRHAEDLVSRTVATVAVVAEGALLRGDCGAPERSPVGVFASPMRLSAVEEMRTLADTSDASVRMRPPSTPGDVDAPALVSVSASASASALATASQSATASASVTPSGSRGGHSVPSDALLLQWCLMLCGFMELDVARKRMLVSTLDSFDGRPDRFEQVHAQWPCAATHSAASGDASAVPSSELLTWDCVEEIVTKITGNPMPACV